MKYIVPALIAVAVAGCATQEAAPAIAGTTWILTQNDLRITWEFRPGGVLESTVFENGQKISMLGDWYETAENSGAFFVKGKRVVSGRWLLKGDTLTFVNDDGGYSAVLTPVK